MGDINLIPGQQAKGKKPAQAAGQGGVEYSTPKSEVEKLVTPQGPSWWERRRAAKAKEKAARLAEQALREAHTPKVAVDLLEDVSPPAPKPVPPPAPPPARLTPTPPAHIPAVDLRPQHSTVSPDEVFSLKQPEHHSPPPKGKKRHKTTPALPDQPLVDVNLIPREFGGPQVVTHKVRELVWYGVAAVIMLAASYGGLRWYEFKLAQDSAALQQEVHALDANITSFNMQRQQASYLQEQLVGLQTILDQHVDYAGFFSFLEANTLPSVYYKTMNIDAVKGTITASAVTADFQHMRQQVAVFQSNPLVTDVSVTSASRTVPTSVSGTPTETVPLGVEPVLFAISLSIDPSVFHP